MEIIVHYHQGRDVLQGLVEKLLGVKIKGDPVDYVMDVARDSPGDRQKLINAGVLSYNERRPIAMEGKKKTRR